MKKTDGMAPLEQTPTQEIDPAKVTHPAEVQVANLRKALADERVKTEALSRRCIRLGEALDAAILAEDNRVEKDMFNHINGNCYRKTALEENRNAMVARQKRIWENQKKAAEAYDKAIRKNAFSLGTSAVIGFGALIFGYAGFIHSALATTIAGTAAVAFGWALNTCVYLFGRCEK